MQKFTRALTREVEIDGERIAVTLSEAGVSLRPVGSRKPPAEVTWSAVLAAAGGAAAPSAPVKDTSDLGDALAKLDDWLAKNRPHVHGGLMESASAAELTALEKALGRPVPPEVTSWLRWHNGQCDDDVGALVAAFCLMSTDDIAAEYAERQKGASDGPWESAWVPLLDDFQGNLVCIDTSRTGHPVIETWRGHETAVQAAPSLLAWVRQLTEDFEGGLYVEDSERGEYIKKG